MEPVILGLEQTEDGTVALTAGNRAVVGVETINLSGDDRGSFIDIRIRLFRLGSDPTATDVPDEPPDEKK